MKKKALFVVSRALFPTTEGGLIRAVQQLNFLMRYFDVDLLYLTHSNDKENAATYIPDIKNIYKFEIPKWIYYIQALRFIFNKLPIQVNYYFNRSVSKFINNNLSKYDAVFCNNIRTAEYVRDKTGIIKYLDYVDAISMNYDKARKRTNLIFRIIYTIDYHRLRKYEKLCLESFDACATISDVDKNYIKS